MTQDEIIEMARQAGFARYMTDGEINWKMYEAFVKLVAAKEREACAKVCDLVAREMDDTNGTTSYIGKLIRARGEQA